MSWFQRGRWAACLLLLALCADVSIARAAARASEVYFSPWDDAEGALLGVLAKASKSIHMQAYLLTSRPIAKALLAAHQRGVRVQLLADQQMALKNGEQLDLLASAGVEVALETRYAAAHNKLVLVDATLPQAVVITGSYNFTWSAQARNAENLLVLRGEQELARRYLANWQRHQRDAIPYASGAVPPAPTFDPSTARK